MFSRVSARSLSEVSLLGLSGVLTVPDLPVPGTRSLWVMNFSFTGGVGGGVPFSFFLGCEERRQDIDERNM